MTAPPTRVALITGGASGIGAACALHAAKSGYAVAISFHRRREEAESVRDRCEALGARTLLVQADVADDAACRAVAKQLADTWGRLDVLVNSAGTTRVVAPGDLEGLTADDFEAAFSVNCRGAFQMVRAARALLEAARGSVVNISSHSGMSGYGSSLAYAASKGALNTLTLGLARSLAPTVRVNAVCPGFVQTDWLKDRLDADTWTALQRKMPESSPLRIAVESGHVAECAFALAASPVTTGQLLVVDAGAHLAVVEPLSK